ncbi:hypothetical protein BH10BAC3_BH10BAC3_38890 [soil metagenome]
MNKYLKVVAGFVLLFALFMTAEYFVLFKNNASGFLGFQLLFFVAAYLIAKWQGYKSLAAWGIDTKKRWLKHLIAGMIMGVLLYGLSFYTIVYLNGEIIQPVPSLTAVLPQLALFCFGTFFSSFSEDILTRGYLYRHFGNKMPVSLFIVLSSSVYLLNHIYRLTGGWETCIYLFLLGVLFVIPMIITKRLWFTGGMHWIGNTTFYFTHTIINTSNSNAAISPNLVFIFCILIFIPISILLVYALKLNKQSTHSGRHSLA